MGARQIFCGSQKLDFTTPVVMGILNLTPDSFYDGGSCETIDDQLRKVESMLADGAAIIDIGAVSTKPGAPEVSEAEELARLVPSLEAISRNFPGTILSVDTFRPAVARASAACGASMINDIYGGRFDPDMIRTVAGLRLPYVLMHMKGTPATMQTDPSYSDVVAEVFYFFERQTELCREMGVTQVIIDPGFGFGKTVEHNFTLLAALEDFRSFQAPILVGLSRKSMINKVLRINPREALNGTTVLNTIALMKGADILRVHDVREAVEAVKLVSSLAINSL